MHAEEHPAQPSTNFSIGSLCLSPISCIQMAAMLRKSMSYTGLLLPLLLTHLVAVSVRLSTRMCCAQCHVPGKGPPCGPVPDGIDGVAML